MQALVDAVQARYDIPQRWYSLKARLLGLDKLADYDRMASVAAVDEEFGWNEARELVLDAYASFSPDLATVGRAVLRRVVDRRADPSGQAARARSARTPCRASTRTCCSTGPSRRRDVLTLAHEMGHGLHAYLAREQGIFHQTTPLTLAETASVFGETVTFGRLLDATDDPGARLALLAESLEGQIATVFRQVAMNRFEDRVHTQRREEGELSIEQFNEAWATTQAAMLGDTVEITEGYRTWWSYIPHFMGTPGYVYAYSYGQLLALSVYRAYEEQRRRVRAEVPGAARGGRVALTRGAGRASWASTSPTPGSGAVVSPSSPSSSRRPRRPPGNPAGSDCGRIPRRVVAFHHRE